MRVQRADACVHDVTGRLQEQWTAVTNVYDACKDVQSLDCAGHSCMHASGGGEGRTPSAVEPLVSPKASPMEKSARSQFSTTSKMALVSAMTSVATFAEKQSPSSSA